MQSNFENQLKERQKQQKANKKFVNEGEEQDDFFSLKPKKNEQAQTIPNPYDSKKLFTQDDEEDESNHYDLQKLRMMQNSVSMSNNSSANLKFKPHNQFAKQPAQNAQMQDDNYGFGSIRGDDARVH